MDKERLPEMVAPELVVQLKVETSVKDCPENLRTTDDQHTLSRPDLFSLVLA